MCVTACSVLEHTQLPAYDELEAGYRCGRLGPPPCSSDGSLRRKAAAAENHKRMLMQQRLERAELWLWANLRVLARWRDQQWMEASMQ